MHMTHTPTIAFAHALLERRSETPDDAGCLDLIAARLAPLGFVLTRIDIDGVSNLWARRGDTRPLMVFAGHTDVVPSGPPERWQSPPFAPQVRDGRLYARGAADMKSSLAAFVTSIERFVATCPDHAGSIALLLTSDEEGPAVAGTVRVVDWLAERDERLDWCIVGEPTSVDALGDMIKNGRRGSLTGILTVLGIQGHVAYPQRARNPVHQLAPALTELVATRWDEGNAYFPPTTFQVANLSAGTGASNVIPGECRLQFNFRYNPESPAETLQARVCALLDRHGLEYRIDWQHSGKPFMTPRGPLVDAMCAAIRQVTGRTPELSTSGGTSDGRFIAAICDQVVEFGPINASIHQIDEHIALDDIEPLADIYFHTLVALLAPGN